MSFDRGHTEFPGSESGSGSGSEKSMRAYYDCNYKVTTSEIAGKDKDGSKEKGSGKGKGETEEKILETALALRK